MKNIPEICIAILFLFSVSFAQSEPVLSIVSEDIVLAKNDVQLHFPFLHESRDGNWYMTYREGRHTSKKETVFCVMSGDKGKTWQPWAGLKVHPKLRLFRTRLKDGSLISHHYLFMVDKKGNANGRVIRSSDGGVTWTKHDSPMSGIPLAAEKQGGMWGHILEMPDGRLLLGIYGKKPDATRAICGVMESQDKGKSWKYLSDICNDVTLGDEGPDEMDIVRLKSGDLLSLFRTGTKARSHMHQSQSKDDGKTWSKARDLGTAAVSPQLLLLENGVLVCTYGTRDVYAMASWDGTGQVWSDPLLIYKGVGTGYTDLISLSDDTFRIAFDKSAFRNNEPGGKIVRVVIKATGLGQ